MGRTFPLSETYVILITRLLSSSVLPLPLLVGYSFLFADLAGNTICAGEKASRVCSRVL